MAISTKERIVRDLLNAAADHAASYLESLAERPVRAELTPEEVRDRLDRRIPEEPQEQRRVLDELVAVAEPGVTAMGSARYFGFVIGGALPAAVAADWLTAAWDQNAGLASPTPSAAAIEELTGAWLIDLLALPPGASFGLVTGCQMAHVTALAAARHRVLADVGWDVEADGLAGAPPVRVIAGQERHVTIDRALRLLGLGTRSVTTVAVDEVGAMRADALAEALDADIPTIVCAQAGNVNTGSVDPLEDVCTLAGDAGAWVHVDGAFGLWANASERYRGLLRGCELADSWATDAHKWLNVPYDSGVAVVADSEAHRAGMTAVASYLQQGDAVREPVDWNPEFSRRARAFPIYAALRTLGRSGVAELVDRTCGCAERFAEVLEATEGFAVLAQSLNQVLVKVADDADSTDRVVAEIQREGTCWLSATTWRGVRCIRISISNWQTTLHDVERSVAAVVSARERALVGSERS